MRWDEMEVGGGRIIYSSETAGLHLISPYTLKQIEILLIFFSKFKPCLAWSIKQIYCNHNIDARPPHINIDIWLTISKGTEWTSKCILYSPVDHYLAHSFLSIEFSRYSHVKNMMTPDLYPCDLKTNIVNEHQVWCWTSKDFFR